MGAFYIGLACHMINITGKGVKEKELFYGICQRRGIRVRCWEYISKDAAVIENKDISRDTTHFTV